MSFRTWCVSPARRGIYLHRLLPFVRLQALESQLKRVLKSLKASGLVDPATGLLRRDAFWQDLERAASRANDNGSALSVARISFEHPIDRRSYTDAARLLSGLVRDVDVACQDEDGSISSASRKPTCAWPMWWRGGSPTCSSTP